MPKTLVLLLIFLPAICQAKLCGDLFDPSHHVRRDIMGAVLQAKMHDYRDQPGKKILLEMVLDISFLKDLSTSSEEIQQKYNELFLKFFYHTSQPPEVLEHFTKEEPLRRFHRKSSKQSYLIVSTSLRDVPQLLELFIKKSFHPAFGYMAFKVEAL